MSTDYIDPEIKEIVDRAFKYPNNRLFEKLAEIEHERWADWQRYLHSRLIKHHIQLNGSNYYLLSADLKNNWERQIETEYDNLSEQEKDSDREQVLRYWDLIKDEVLRLMPDRMEFSNKFVREDNLQAWGYNMAVSEITNKLIKLFKE